LRRQNEQKKKTRAICFFDGIDSIEQTTTTTTTQT